jgi:hypothetical protein
MKIERTTPRATFDSSGHLQRGTAIALRANAFHSASKVLVNMEDGQMIGKMTVVALLALTFGTSAFAEDNSGSVEVIVKGIMQEDKGGMFIVADGQYFDLVFNEESSADMKKFHSGLEGDMVKVTGVLVVEKSKQGNVRLLVLANDVARLRGVRSTVVKIEPRVVEERPVYVRERRSGIHLPGVHINW